MHTKNIQCTYERWGLLPSTCGKSFIQMIIFILIFQHVCFCNQISFRINECHVLPIEYNMINTTLPSLLPFNNTNQLKYSHNLVVGESWSMNELVVVVVHLAQKFKHIIRCLNYTHFPLFPKAWDDIFMNLGICNARCYQLWHSRSYLLWRQYWLSFLI